jgi:hypothetical protein
MRSAEQVIREAEQSVYEPPWDGEHIADTSRSTPPARVQTDLDMTHTLWCCHACMYEDLDTFIVMLLYLFLCRLLWVGACV